MEVLLGLAIKVSREYGFSAFVLALMMLLFYWMVTNPRLIKVADRVLNQSLTSTNLYRFIKLAIILVFVFSTIVAVLSFATPVLMRHVENQSLELVTQGKTAFRAKDYDKARAILEQSLNLMNPDEPSADEIRGLITATYYVSGRHEQGLDFICDQYRHKPAADRSYLFAVHAHLRKVSVDGGRSVAENLATQFRRKCNRVDFTPFWAHIPFGMMESLRTARLRTEHGWHLTEEAVKRLRELLAQEQQAALSKKIPLGDFALYFLGEFDQLLQDYPDSGIRDMALFDAAMFSSGSARIQYLTRLVESHKNSPRYEDAIIQLASLLADIGQREQALSFIALLKTSRSLDRATLVAVRPTLLHLGSFIRDADFAASQQLVTEACRDFSQKSLPCPQVLSLELRKTELALKSIATPYAKLKCSKIHSKLRELAAIEDGKVDPKWLSATRSFLNTCLEASSDDPEDYARSLYLTAALSRKLGDYKSSLASLQRFQREITEHDLLDDVLTEIGYHKLVIEGDWPAAKTYFGRVVEEFPHRNAQDNALWWYARGSTRDGAYGDAIAAYARISASDLASRLKKWSGSEQLALQRLMEHPPFKGIALRPRNVDEGGIAIAAIADDSPAAKILRAGDRLIRLCRKPVYAIEDTLAIMAEMDAANPCDVSYLRGQTLVHFSREDSGSWQVRQAHLSAEDLRRLVHGI